MAGAQHKPAGGFVGVGLYVYDGREGRADQ